VLMQESGGRTDALGLVADVELGVLHGVGYHTAPFQGPRG